MILHLTRDYPPRRSGGLSSAVESTVRGLASVGVRSRVISFDGWGRKGSAASDVLPRSVTDDETFRVRGSGDLDDARQWSARQENTLVHVHDPMLWPLGTAISATTRAPCVHSLHVLSHHQDALRGLQVATKTTTAQAQAIVEAEALIAPSPAVATKLIADFPHAATRTHVARLGIDYPRSASSEREGLLFVGRFTDMAGIADLVEIVSLLETSSTLTIVGGLPDNPRAQKRWSTSLSQAALERGRDIIETGWLSGEALAQRYRSAAILIAPNRYATFGLAVAEAMANAVAVCAYRVGGLVDLLEDGVTGRLTESSPGKLASAIDALDRDQEQASALGSAAQERIKTSFGPALATEELLAVYRSVDWRG